jgi:P4 family phage/plasmid primase-like protien
VNINERQAAQELVQDFPYLAETTISLASSRCEFWLKLEAECDYPQVDVITLWRNERRVGELRLSRNGGASSVIRHNGKTPKEIDLSDLDELAQWGTNTLGTPGPASQEAPTQEPNELPPVGSTQLAPPDAGEEIAWADSKQKKIQHLLEAFGPPLHRNQQDAPSRLNERFWAEFLAIERILIFEHDERQFYLYNPSNGRYESLTAQVLKAHLSDLLREADLKWGGCYGITTLDTEKARSSIVELTRGIVEKRDFFVNRPWAIHCQNTMLVIEEGQIKPKPFSPHFRSRNQLSVAYEPKKMCPTFQKELLEPAVCQEDIELIQKMFGLMVLGINRPQRIFILQGAPNTGKTTLGRLITTLIGRWNYSELRTQHLNERFETSRALGKTLLFGPDVKAHFLQSEGAHKLKSMVGGDPMDAERKNSNASFPFPGELNVLITSNSRLLVKLEGDIGAWLRRLTIIEFLGQGSVKRIDGFHEILLRQEGSGILNWALAGLLKYEQDHQIKGDIVLSDNQKMRVAGLLSESDGLRTFLQTELVLTKGASLTEDEITIAFAEYARNKQWRLLKASVMHGQVQDLMMELFCISKSHDLKREGTDKNGEPKTLTLRGYHGVRLRRADEEDPDL